MEQLGRARDGGRLWRRAGGLAVVCAAAIALQGCSTGRVDLDRIVRALSAPSAPVSTQATAAAAIQPGPNALIDARLEPVPQEFESVDTAVWDGKRTLQGIWVAHPAAETARRVRILNLETGYAVDGALFRRDDPAGDMTVLVSSDAASALGMDPGAAVELSIVAVRRMPDAVAAATEAAPPTDTEGEAGAGATDAAAETVNAAAATAAVEPAGEAPEAATASVAAPDTALDTAAAVEAANPAPEEAIEDIVAGPSATVEEAAGALDPDGPTVAETAETAEAALESTAAAGEVAGAPEAAEPTVDAAAGATREMMPEAGTPVSPEDADTAASYIEDWPIVPDDQAANGDEAEEGRTASAAGDTPVAPEAEPVGDPPAPSASPSASRTTASALAAPGDPPVEESPIRLAEPTAGDEPTRVAEQSGSADEGDGATAEADIRDSAAAETDAATDTGAVTGSATELAAVDASRSRGLTPPSAPDGEPAPEPAPADASAGATATTDVGTPGPEAETEARVAAVDPAGGAEPATGPATGAAIERPYIQAGVFGVATNADRLVEALRGAGYEAEGLPTQYGSRVLTRVLAGPFATEEERNDALRAIRRIGPADALPVER